MPEHTVSQNQQVTRFRTYAAAHHYWRWLAEDYRNHGCVVIQHGTRRFMVRIKPETEISVTLH